MPAEEVLDSAEERYHEKGYLSRHSRWKWEDRASCLQQDGRRSRTRLLKEILNFGGPLTETKFWGAETRTITIYFYTRDQNCEPSKPRK